MITELDFGPGQDQQEARSQHTPGYVCTDEACMCNATTPGEESVWVPVSGKDEIQLPWGVVSRIAADYSHVRTLTRNRQSFASKRALKALKTWTAPYGLSSQDMREIARWWDLEGGQESARMCREAVQKIRSGQ